MNKYDIAEESYKNGYKKGYRDGRVDLLKMIKITYCSNNTCPYVDCYKHLANSTSDVRTADFSVVCRKYIHYLVDELLKDTEVEIYD
jgi:hypothetical protein